MRDFDTIYEIMNLTLEELRKSIAKQEMELYGRTLSDDKIIL